MEELSGIAIVFLSLIVLSHAYSRFHSPPTNRSTTTAVRYYTAAAVYSAGYLVVFFLLLENPIVISMIASAAGIENVNSTDGVMAGAAANLQTAVGSLTDGPTRAVTLALIVGTVVPNVPGIAKLDRAARDRLSQWALIGYQAYDMSEQLVESGFRVPADVRAQVVEKLKRQQLGEAALALDAEDASGDEWVRIVSLCCSFEQLGQKAGLAPFYRERQSDFEKIKHRFERLERMATTLFTEIRPARDCGDGAARRIAGAFEDSFRNEADGLLRTMCLQLSEAALSEGLTRQKRNRLIESVGFERLPKPESTVDFVVLVSLILFALTVAVNVGVNALAGSDDLDVWSAIQRSFIVVVSGIFTVTVAWWMRVSHGSPYEGGLRPLTTYLLAGLLSAAAFAPVRLAMRAWMEGGADLEALFLSEWQMLLLTFAGTVAVAWCLDNRGTRLGTGWPMRVTEALGVAALLVATALLVIRIGPPAESYLNETGLVIVACVHGLIMGSMVPGWRRSPMRQQRAADRHRFDEGEAAFV